MKQITYIKKCLLNSHKLTPSISFDITTNDINNYNKVVSDKLSTNDGFGVYIWSDENGNVLYIGIAGKLKKSHEGEAEMNGRKISDRLKASRGDYNSTCGFLSQIAFNLNVDGLEKITFDVFILNKTTYVPAYVESSALQKFYEKYNTLPKYNKEF